MNYPKKKWPRRPKIIFVNRFFFPDHSATSQILSDLAFHLAGDEASVCVITSRQIYDNADAVLPAREYINGVDVTRVITTTFGRRTLVGRGMDYLTFYMMAGWALLLKCRRNDIVIAKTDPPLISLVCVVIAKLKGARLVNWLQDLFPEVAIRLGVGLGEGRIGRALVFLRNVSLRFAEKNVAIGVEMQRLLLGQGISAEKLEVISNWSDDEALIPIDREQNPLRNEWGICSEFVVGYSGNLGRAHDANTIIETAKRVEGRADIKFLMIGGGIQFSQMQERAAADGLSNIIFKPYQARKRLAASLGVADLHIVMLQANLEGLIVPSKFYGVAAAGRAVAFLGSKTGEIARVVLESGCGAVFDIGDSVGLAEYIQRLSEDREVSKRLGRNARLAIDRKYSKWHSFEAWDAVLSQIMLEMEGNR